MRELARCAGTRAVAPKLRPRPNAVVGSITDGLGPEATDLPASLRSGRLRLGSSTPIRCRSGALWSGCTAQTSPHRYTSDPLT